MSEMGFDINGILKSSVGAEFVNLWDQNGSRVFRKIKNKGIRFDLLVIGSNPLVIRSYRWTVRSNP